MADRIRFVLVGGFLGAGKTTLLARLAGLYQAQGLRVGLVTNDQAADLVDTNLLREQGFEVGEVAGACFCCQFDELVTTIGRLGAHERPDIILAEPVGSCTDLVATVIQPLKHMFDADISVAPFAVILKPSHGQRVLQGGSRSGFSPKAEYILRKQLEEADVIVINRADELSDEAADELASLVQSKVPGTPVIRISARTGGNVGELVNLLEQEGDFGRRILNIDYDTYAEGEAELGWLNATVKVSSETGIDVDRLLLDTVRGLQTRLQEDQLEPAHLKVIALTATGFGVANLISSDQPAELSLPARQMSTEVELVINMRVAGDPGLLDAHMNALLEEQIASHGWVLEKGRSSNFRPGRPNPTHRYNEVS